MVAHGGAPPHSKCHNTSWLAQQDVPLREALGALNTQKGGQNSSPEAVDPQQFGWELAPSAALNRNWYMGGGGVGGIHKGIAGTVLYPQYNHKHRFPVRLDMCGEQTNGVERTTTD